MQICVSITLCNRPGKVQLDEPGSSLSKGLANVEDAQAKPNLKS